jgi:hypothetical protein
MFKKFGAFQLNHKNFWTKANRNSMLTSSGFFIVALIIQKIADNYVLKIKGTVVDDMILNNLPTVDLDFFIIQGALIITFLGLFLLVYKPKYFCFGLKAFSLFIIIRSFLISLTHLGVSPDQLVLDINSIGFGLYNILYNTTNDFFFSGHTGMPFLMALVFCPEKFWRYTFFTASAVMGTSVLLAHMHYSIDVFAAPFITYSIFALTRQIFKKDFQISRAD